MRRFYWRTHSPTNDLIQLLRLRPSTRQTAQSRLKRQRLSATVTVDRSSLRVSGNNGGRDEQTRTRSITVGDV